MRGHIRKYRGRWAGVVELGRDPVTGKRRQKWIYADTKKECEVLVAELIYKLESGTYFEPTKMSVAEYLRHWIKVHSPNLAKSTVDDYTGVIENHLIPELGNLPLAKLSPLHLQDLYKRKQEEYSGRTVQKIHRILRKALDVAVKTQLIKQNPADLVDTPKAKKYKPNIYDEKEFLTLLKTAEGTEHHIPILLAGGLGMRRGEIFGLKWRNVDFKNCKISVTQQLIPTSKGLVYDNPKTYSGTRIIEVPKYIIDLLKKQKKRQKEYKIFYGPEYVENDLVCCKPNGEPVNPSTYSHRFANFLKENGLKHIRFHDLRHFNGTIMLKYNIPVKVASQRLGHSTTAITQDIYQHVLSEIDNEAAQKINDGLFGALNRKG
ncbi:MAG: site-specific integrase [Caldicoprobacterales bacterium]|nr:site-specific integrase [Clostridiales bacterium]